jgi:phytoene synthase
MNSTMEQSYERCRAINRRHGQTYYWATEVLPRDRRPHVHALYAFCRLADDIVDDLGDAPVAARSEALQEYGERFQNDLAAGASDDDVLAAVVDTVVRYDIDTECFERFLHSMTMDLTVTQYESFPALMEYMDGSAAVIGEMMMPVLGATAAAAREPARDLGIAFQLTNFLRDVGEDLDRGRVYLPQTDLERFAADPAARRVTPEWRALMQFEIERTRHIYTAADEGLTYLPSRSARCITAARVLYSEILVEIERNDYDVFTRRASVSTARKASVAAGALIGLPLGSRRPARPSTDARSSRWRRLSTGSKNP